MSFRPSIPLLTYFLYTFAGIMMLLGSNYIQVTVFGTFNVGIIQIVGGILAILTTVITGFKWGGWIICLIFTYVTYLLIR